MADFEMLLSAYNNKIEMPTEELPIILDEGLFHLILKDVIAEYNMTGSSILSGKLKQKVFSDKLNVAITRSYNEKVIVPFFDDEGVINQNDSFDIIKDGVLTGVLATKRSASMFNIECSGSSNSVFDGVPNFGVEGLEVKDTDKKLSDIVNKGIYVSITSGGDITPDGTIGMPVQLAFLYENGKIVGRLPEFMLSGNIFSVLGDSLKGIAKTDFLNYPDTQIVTKMDIKNT